MRHRVYYRGHKHRVNYVSVDECALSQATRHNCDARGAVRVLKEPVEVLLIIQLIGPERPIANEAAIRLNGECIPTYIKSNRGDTYMQEILSNYVHLIAFADLACLQQCEAQLHQDDVDRGNYYPVLEQFILELLGLVDVVEVGGAREIFGEGLVR